ncbi:MAG: methyltransferase [Bacteroidetes bacterium]|nr:methyltransferase [Bacteroidota bacterium]
MRVITGLYKGRTIKTVDDLSVRPATDRVKQSIFNMLMNRLDLEGAHVLDLFAGSGNLGIEALSRGAAHVTFVESNEGAAECIERNIDTLGCEEAATILEMDAIRYIGNGGGPFDLIFADPPYAFEETVEIPGLVFGKALLQKHGYLLIEHASNLHFISTAQYHVGPEKKFGQTMVTFFRHPRPEEPVS